MAIEFDFFEAGHGDSILVSTEHTHILIDGGVSETYEEEIEPKIDLINKLDLVVLTHIDNDHICGLIEMLTEDNENTSKIKEIWFNSFNAKIDDNSSEVSCGSGLLFEKLIEKKGILHNKNIFLKENNTYKISRDIELVLLSPRKKELERHMDEWNKDKNQKIRLCNGRHKEEVCGKPCIDKRDIDTIIKEDKKYKYDTSLSNKTSIAFILKYKNESFVFLADADIRIINESLIRLGYSPKNRLEANFVKLSHHGSIGNINKEFLNLVETDTFITLTDCSKYAHPDKETFSMILTHENRKESINLIFNYQDIITKKFTEENKKSDELKYAFKAYCQQKIKR